MILKLMGIVLVIAGCGGIGFRIAANHRQEEKNLRQLIGILDYMECELQYRLTPLPALCRQAAKEFPGMLGNVFLELALEMEAQASPDMECCMSAALCKARNLPPITKEGMELLGKTIGRFDIEGQLKGLEAVRQDCRRNLECLSDNRDNRLRSYQTLGLCAGAALAILFV
ncbi:MAG: stage III sporulation protein AB [Oscillospiraceae bacterium]|nr:stage III sporulation protein AB [Oscillospiraceae bacterium]